MIRRVVYRATDTERLMFTSVSAPCSTQWRMAAPERTNERSTDRTKEEEEEKIAICIKRNLSTLHSRTSETCVYHRTRSPCYVSWITREYAPWQAANYACRTEHANALHAAAVVPAALHYGYIYLISLHFYFVISVSWNTGIWRAIRMRIGFHNWIFNPSIADLSFNSIFHSRWRCRRHCQALLHICTHFVWTSFSFRFAKIIFQTNHLSIFMVSMTDRQKMKNWHSNWNRNPATYLSCRRAASSSNLLRNWKQQQQQIQKYNIHRLCRAHGPGRTERKPNSSTDNSSRYWRIYVVNLNVRRVYTDGRTQCKSSG